MNLLKDNLGRFRRAINLIGLYKYRLQGLGNMLQKEKSDQTICVNKSIARRLKWEMSLQQKWVSIIHAYLWIS